MSALGHSRTFALQKGTSTLPPLADAQRLSAKWGHCHQLIAKRETAACGSHSDPSLRSAGIGDDPGLINSASRIWSIAELLRVLCAVDHKSESFSHFRDYQHTFACIEKRKRAAPRLHASLAQTSLATRKVPTIPGRTWNYVEEFRCRDWSITDKATTEVVPSQERPSGSPGRPFL
jgi:hypothetical protein